MRKRGLKPRGDKLGLLPLELGRRKRQEVVEVVSEGREGEVGLLGRGEGGGRTVATDLEREL